MPGTAATRTDLAARVEHTLLKPEARPQDIERLCDEAIAFGFRGVCINSRFVSLVKSRLAGTPVLTVSVIGFPLGAMATDAKAKETEIAVRAGADEIDMVLALGAAKAGDWAEVTTDIAAVVAAADGRLVKVILETGLLTTDEIVHACTASASAGAAFVKTATGFLGRGATIEDIVLMRRSVPAGMRIKASGGIKTFADALRLIESGADSLGTSSGPALVTDGASATAGY